MTWTPRPPPLFARSPTPCCAERRPRPDEVVWPGPIRAEAPVIGQHHQGEPIPSPGQMFPPLTLEGQHWFTREWKALRLTLSDEPSLAPTTAKLDEVAEGQPSTATQPWTELHSRSPRRQRSWTRWPRASRSQRLSRGPSSTQGGQTCSRTSVSSQWGPGRHQRRTGGGPCPRPRPAKS